MLDYIHSFRMDSIPIFSGKSSSLEASTSCGQFISMLDQESISANLPEEKVKELCLLKVSDEALDFCQANADKSWSELKSLMLKQFCAKLSIAQKVELRKTLKQNPEEEIDDFYYRCLQVQYFVSDDIRDATFDREVLLNFLLGLQPFIQNTVLAANCSNTQEFIQEAKRLFAIPKAESVEVKIKTENLEFPDDFDFNEDFGADFDFEDDDDGENEKFDPSVDITNFAELEEESILKAYGKKKKKKVVVDNNADKHIKCILCDKKFRTVKGRERHIAQSHKDAQKTCDICKEVSPDIQSLARHVVSNHCIRNESKQYICLYCGTIKRVKLSAIRNHILADHWGYKNVRYQCPECDREFEGKCNLNHHVRTFHMKEKPYQCDKCPKSFKVPEGLKKHVQIKHEETEPVKCDQCEKIFPHVSNLKQHLRIMHSGDKLTFICSTCGKVFKTKHNLQIHNINAHSSAEEKEKHMFHCDYEGCNYKNLVKGQVEDHKNRVHLKIKKFQCSHCPNMFASPQGLREHVDGTHLGIKPNKCDICDFATACRF